MSDAVELTDEERIDYHRGVAERALAGQHDIARQRDEALAEVAALRRAVKAVTDATCAYLPPDGISKDECINRVLGATDNPEINAVMRRA